MTAAALVLLDYRAVVESIQAFNCFTSVSDFAKRGRVSPNTLNKIRRGEPVFESTAIKLAEAINVKRRLMPNGASFPQVQWRSWLRNEASEAPGPLPIRQVQGRWQIVATDVQVPEARLNYAKGPQRLSMYIDVTQDGRKLTALGIDEDGDPVKAWDAELSEDGIYITGRHFIYNESVRLHGVFMLKFLNTGRHMRGYYLQCETSHETGCVFGTLQLTRDDSN